MSQAFIAASEPRTPRRSLIAVADRVLGLADRVPQGICRFLVAGGLSSLVNWLVRFPLSAGLPYGAAVALAYGVGMVAGFGLYRSWVFPGSSLRLRAQILRFVLVNLAGLSVVVVSAQTLAAVMASTGLAGVPTAEAVAHGLGIILGAVVNFLGHRAVTFARAAGASRVAAEAGAR